MPTSLLFSPAVGRFSFYPANSKCFQISTWRHNEHSRECAGGRVVIQSGYGIRSKNREKNKGWEPHNILPTPQYGVHFRFKYESGQRFSVWAVITGFERCQDEMLQNAVAFNRFLWGNENNGPQQLEIHSRQMLLSSIKAAALYVAQSHQSTAHTLKTQFVNLSNASK